MEMKKKVTGKLKKIVALSISIIICGAGIAGCGSREYSVSADDLMEGVKAGNITGLEPGDEFIGAQADFGMELFKSTVESEKKNKNILVSPLSVTLALSMTANGSDGETKEQMENLLGGKICIEDMNKYLYSYVKRLPGDGDNKIKIANSLWFKNNDSSFNVKKSFLQINADYYNAQAYGSGFDDNTLKDMNNWVKKNTDGLIDKAVEHIEPRAVMYIINALLFDGKWEEGYRKNDISENVFHRLDGTDKQCKMMLSSEEKYIDTDNAVGFIKYYKNREYAFVALLPDADVDLYRYINSLTGEKWIDMIENAESRMVHTMLPKFEYDYDTFMGGILAKMGMQDAFDPYKADFSKMGTVGAEENLYIGDVIHKTHITVDELGTKAGAITVVVMENKSAIEQEEIPCVYLDRPFVYGIIDCGTNLPIFIGALVEP